VPLDRDAALADKADLGRPGAMPSWSQRITSSSDSMNSSAATRLGAAGDGWPPIARHWMSAD